MFKKFGKQILGSTFIVSGSSAATYKYVTKTHEEAENSRNIELENSKIIKQELDSKKYLETHEITPDFIKKKYFTKDKKVEYQCEYIRHVSM